MYFDGSGDYIKAVGVQIGRSGSSDFTAEGWFYLQLLLQTILLLYKLEHRMHQQQAG